MEEPIEQQVSPLTSLLMNEIMFPAELAKYENEVNKHLSDPNLLNWVCEVLDKRIVGEKLTKLLLFLVASSYKANDPQGVIISGPPSIGKSWAAKNILRFFPNVLNMSRITMAFLDRTGGDISHYILYVSELGGQEQATPTLRVMLSEGELKLGTVDIGQKGPTPRVIETKGTPVYFTTTTKQIIEPQLVARTWLLNLDESREQTQRILKFQAKRAKRFTTDKYTHEEMVLKSLIYALKQFDVLVPYSDELSERFPPGELNARRDFKRLLSLIKCVALLFQRQRLKLEIDGKTAIVASLSDLLMATQIVKPVMLPTIYSLPSKALDFIETFQETPDLEYTARSMGSEHRLSQGRAREILNGLMERGFVYRDRAKRPYKFNWSGKTLEEGTIFSIVSLKDFFSEEAFGKWLEPNAVFGYQVNGWQQIININIPKLYEEFMAPFTSEANTACLSEAKQEAKSEKNQKRGTMHHIKPQTTLLIDTLNGKEEAVDRIPLKPKDEAVKPLNDQAIDKAFPPLGMAETHILLRSKWTRGTNKETQEKEFLDRIHQVRPDLTRKEAGTLFAKLIEEGAMTYDSEGFLIWVK